MAAPQLLFNRTMLFTKRLTRRLTAPLFSLAFVAGSWAFAAVPTPKEHFGFNIGDDYQLANYTQTEAYFKKVTAAASDRMKLVDIGPTGEGRRQYMIVATSPENMAKLEHYREIAAKLARAEGLSDAEARKLADEGKAIIWIDGGLHATETVGSHQLIETVYQIATRNDSEMQRFLKDCIVLLVHCNPDGQELTANWYMRQPVPEKRVLDTLPKVYNKYAGHDNNRDFYMAALDETINMNKVAYLQWYPQVMYNHHQTAPTGTIIAIPPYRNPVNPNMDPLVPMGVEAIAASMENRYLVENKPGVTNRGGTVYSIWWNGGLRTAPYFHNMIGLLTEIAGNPTPMKIALVPERQFPSTDLPYPIAPQLWHYRQSIEYSLTANWAVLDYASRHREQMLYNLYKMGRNSIERGSRDSWTPNPHRIAQVAKEAAAAAAAARKKDGPEEDALWASYNADGIDAKYYKEIYRPEDRDPRGYVIPASQKDFPRAVEFVNALIKCGIQVQLATSEFTVAGKTYPAGSYVVKCDQAFRPHVLDMFEPQDHPNDFRYEGGPPIPPYDSAGWTLAFTMGVQFDRVMDGFEGPFKKLPLGELQKAAPGGIQGTGAGYLVSNAANRSYYLAYRFLKAGLPVFRVEEAVPAATGVGAGSFYIPASDEATKLLSTLCAETGVSALAVADKPTVALKKMTKPRVALWDEYGGSMPSGWTRLIFDQMGFDYDVVFAQQIDAGNLRAKYDVIVLPTGAVPMPKAMLRKAPRMERTKVDEATVPAEYKAWLGKITEEKSVPALVAFLEQGGKIIAEGSSTALAYYLKLPLRDHLVELVPDGSVKPLPHSKYYVPGSVLDLAVDNTSPITWGLDKRLDMYFSDGRFDNAPVFKMTPGLAERGVRPLLWFDSPTPLRSGWAWGQGYLEGGMLGAEATVGKGKLYLFGVDVTFRAQTQASYKLIFNSLFQGAVEND